MTSKFHTLKDLPLAFGSSVHNSEYSSQEHELRYPYDHRDHRALSRLIRWTERLLGLSIVWSIGALTCEAIDKTGLGFGDAHDCDWRPYVETFLGGCAINLKLDQVAQRVDDIGAKHLAPLRRPESDLYPIVQSEARNGGSVIRARTHDIADRRIDWPSFMVDVECHPQGQGCVAFEFGKRHFDDRVALEELGISDGIGHLVSVRNGFQVRHNERSHRLVHFRKGLALFDRFPSHFEDIEIRPRDPVISRDGEGYFTALPDLTERQLSSMAITDGSQNSVGSNYYLIAANKHNDGGRACPSRKKPDQKTYCEPQFMRRNDQAGRWSYIDLDTLDEAELVSGIDIDVSCDGTRWFHMLGTNCLRHERPFYTASSSRAFRRFPVRPKRDR